MTDPSNVLPVAAEERERLYDEYRRETDLGEEPSWDAVRDAFLSALTIGEERAAALPAVLPVDAAEADHEAAIAFARSNGRSIYPYGSAEYRGFIAGAEWPRAVAAAALVDEPHEAVNAALRRLLYSAAREAHVLDHAHLNRWADCTVPRCVEWRAAAVVDDKEQG